jgi:LmbE family N-acetylglucosaminyl deacetylase
MNPYVQLVSDHARWIREGRSAPLGGFTPAHQPVHRPDAPVVLIFSPHPDDECIVGGLPLRLQRESGWRVINVAVTQGSRQDRQAERLVELKAACDHLGFGLETIGKSGLEKVTPQARSADPSQWAAKVQPIADILQRLQPRAILFPHQQDWNGTHIGVHHLVLDALAQLGPDFSTHLVETEFWGQNYQPNLLVEIPEPILADLITALTFHVGEVRRNPYHLTLPAWMTNNVRLGGETVGGQGAAPPDFPFGTVYRLRRWTRGAIQEIQAGGRVLTASDDPEALFR